MIRYNVVLRSAITAIMLFVVLTLRAQDINYARHLLNNLCSPEFYGRAYFNKGDSLAANFISSELRKHGVKSFGQTFFQPYSFGVNILDEVSVRINSKELKFGTDYMMGASSGSSSGVFRPLIVNAALMKNPQKLLDSIVNKSSPDDVVLLDSTGLKNPEFYRFLKTFILNGLTKSSGLIEILPKIGIGLVGNKEFPVSHIQIDARAMPESVTGIQLNIRNRFDSDYSTRNVIGYIPGQTDKFIVFTAHYDGIGSFGNGNYFPGASDNASGTVMVMDLARYFATGKKPYYSIAFMLFSGEEAGLLGSSYYVDHPLFPLDQIKLVINLDMVGTGQDGVILFNGTERPVETSVAQSINEKKHYMKSIDVVGPAANSDHHPFHQKDVPAIFFLTKGPSGGGHNTGDRFDKLPLYAYNDLFRLVLDMLEEIENQELK